MNNEFSEYLVNRADGGNILNEQFREKLKIEKGVDYIIPDFVSDVESILICTAEPCIDGKYINGNYVEIEGTLNISILIATENNTLSSLSYSEPFDCKVAVEELNDNCRVFVEPSTESVNARLVNPRKLNVHYQINCDTRVYRSVILMPEITGIQSIDDDLNLQRKYRNVMTASPASYEEKGINVSLDTELDANLPQIRQIIFCKARVTPNDIKIKDGEAMIRSEAALNCIYETIDGDYREVEKKFTLEKAINGVMSADCQWYANAVTDKVKTNVASNSYGEMKIIEFDFTYCLELFGMQNNEVSSVSDAFSTEYECETRSSEIGVTVFQRGYATNVSINSFVSREEADAADVRNIFTGNVEIGDIGVSYDADRKKIVTEGIASVSLVCENNIIVENEKLFSLHKYDFPFKCETDTGDDHLSTEFLVDHYVSDVKYRADSANLYADFEMNIRLCSLEKKNVKYIETVKIDKNAPILRSAVKMTLCYPSDNEELWDIAKNYKITCESISVANGLENDDIGDKRVLVIPNSEKKRPVFSKVI